MGDRSHRVCVAPMMDCTDRHCRYFHRLFGADIRLYTEMVTAHAVVHGDARRLLAFSAAEQPVALQLGGSDPELLAQAAAIVANGFAYDELNLNVGCPSDRVQSGRFGACLMADPARVADCVRALTGSWRGRVTVKCRIGIDDRDDYPFLADFVDTVAGAGCDTFLVHARKAILSGLSPRQNREVPPLRYDHVHRLKTDFPALRVIINGGIDSVASARTQLAHVDGVMVGRKAYADPCLLARLQAEILDGDDAPVIDRAAIVRQMAEYARAQLAEGVRLRQITRHMHGLYAGRPGAARWRRFLAESATRDVADPDVLIASLEIFDQAA